MEERKGKGGLVVALVIFVILTICFGGYIAYDKFSIKDNDKGSNNTTTINKETENSNKAANQVKEPSKISVTEFSFDSIAIVSEGSVYVNVYGSTPEIDNLFGNGTFQTLVATRNTYKEYTFNNFEYSKDNSTFKGMKLNANNVEKVYSYEYGQAMAPNYGLILLNKDKTLSIISLYSLIHGKTDVKSISNLSGIDSIISEIQDGITTYAIKENGEKVNLNDYIPKDYRQF